jgi:hypothetical protein
MRGTRRRALTLPLGDPDPTLAALLEELDEGPQARTQELIQATRQNYLMRDAIATYASLGFARRSPPRPTSDSTFQRRGRDSNPRSGGAGLRFSSERREARETALVSQVMGAAKACGKLYGKLLVGARAFGGEPCAQAMLQGGHDWVKLCGGW